MISPDRLIAKLQRDLTRRTCSFSEYVTVSSPYVAPGQEGLWDLISRNAAEERAHADRIARLIVSLGGVPQPGLFNEGVADTNYLKITYLAGLIEKHKEQDIRDAEERIADCSGYPAARELFLEILETDKRQLCELRLNIARLIPVPAATPEPAPPAEPPSA